MLTVSQTTVVLLCVCRATIALQLGTDREAVRAGWSRTVRKAFYGMTWAGEAAITLVDNFRATAHRRVARGEGRKALFFCLQSCRDVSSFG
jgi:hypothetical protein